MPALRSLPSLLAAGALTLVACTGGSQDDTRGTEPVFTTTTTIRTDDRLLRLGLLRDPRAPPAMESSVANAAKIAVEQINAAGGVAGQPVMLVEAGGGDLNSTTAAAISRLLDNDVDAIIGPLSSSDALADLASIVERGVMACSPIASAMALDAFPDHGLFFRTMPSDSLAAAAIATTVERAGAATVSLAYLDDPFGRPFAEAVAHELEARGLQVRNSLGFDAASIDATAQAIADGRPSDVVVLADAVTGPTLIAAVDQLMRLSQPSYFVNDAQRHPQPPQPLAEATVQRITAVSATTTPTEDAVTEAVTAIDPTSLAAFAGNAFDCVNLIALAATSAGSTLPGEFAGDLVGVSTSGSKCTTFATCRDDLVQGRNIDYDGASRVLDLGANGDPARALFEQVSLFPDGHDRVVDRFPVSARSLAP